MNATECMKGRRSIRKYKKGCIDHSLLESIISTASYSPSWKNTQITRYIAIEDTLFSIKLPMNSPQTIIRILSDKFQH